MTTSKKLQKILDWAHRRNRINAQGLVLCGNCETPASRSLSLQMSWTGCAPCFTGESKSYDPTDVIQAELGRKAAHA